MVSDCLPQMVAAASRPVLTASVLANDVQRFEKHTEEKNLTPWNRRQVRTSPTGFGTCNSLIHVEIHHAA